jgi:3D-(3,5/4)-trihydroxycyclohexane-1,2-dione acylhydrolase (decyclizing)
MCNLRLTTAQALVRYLTHQFVEIGGDRVPFFAGAWAIFGHGNVAGLGEALHATREILPTFRAQNEQAMAHAAIAYAKQMRRRRAMVCTTSIGPGATNMVTAAALAHVDRLPVLLLPGDVFANRRPDPVLQQIEDFNDGLITANDCFRPVSRYFDRIMRPEQLLKALPQAMAVLTDPAECGPVTLGLCQDVQAEAYDFPEWLFAPRTWRIRAPQADAREIDDLVEALQNAHRPLMIVGGGVKYAGAEEAVADFVRRYDLPFAETQAGKGAIVWDHPNNLGGIGVTGTRAANDAAQAADLIIGVGTRLQDFTTGSAALFASAARVAQINVNPFDAAKFGALTVAGDAGAVLSALSANLGDWRAPAEWLAKAHDAKAAWNAVVDGIYAATSVPLTDAEVLGALQRSLKPDTVVVCAAGGLPGELHKLWRVSVPGGYHLEYGYSCMGYEIPGAIGVKMAAPERDVCAVIGDGGYLMMNSELASAAMLGTKLIVVLLDNGGFGCIDRLQRSVGNESFNNLFRDCRTEVLPGVDFAAHARALGAVSEIVTTPAELEAAIGRAYAAVKSTVVVVRTNPEQTTREGGAWWDVAPPAVTGHGNDARHAYEAKLATIKKGN